MVMFAVVVNYIIRHILIALDRGMISALKAAKSETPTDSKIPSDPYETVDVHGMEYLFNDLKGGKL
jgi:hypothetical protein